MTFTPSDTDNYNAVDMKISLTVNKAAKAPNMPQAAMAPAHSTKKVGDITLPDGWSWQEADRDTALADGVWPLCKRPMRAWNTSVHFPSSSPLPHSVMRMMHCLTRHGCLC